MDKTTTIFFIIIIVFAIAGIAFGAYVYFTPTMTTLETQEQQSANQIANQEDPYTGWKTYTNEKYGFSFRYPNNWTMSTKNSPTSSISITNFSTTKFSLEIESDCCREGIINYSDFPIKLDGKNLKYKLYGYAKNLGESNIDSGNPKRLALLAIPSSFLKTANDLNSQGVEIKLMFNINDQKEAIDLFNQILSTFKFIDSQSTAGWKTYANEKYGFSFRYPGDWTFNTKEIGLKSSVDGKNILETIFKNNEQNQTLRILNRIPEIGYEAWRLQKTEKIQIPNSDKYFTKQYYEEAPEYKNQGYGNFILVWWDKNDLSSGQMEIDYKDYGDSNIKMLNQILSTFKFTK